MPYYSDLTIDLPRPETGVRAAETTRSWPVRVLLLGVPALVAGLVYLNALHNPFVYDDFHTVVQNTSVQNLTSARALDRANFRALLLHDVSRPIVNISYGLDRVIWGPSSFGFHVTNVVLHVVNVMLLLELAWLLVSDVRGSRPALVAFATAVLFAVHPMMTEAVGYVSGRSEVLCATFFLAAFLCGRRWLRDGWAWSLPTIALWGTALASKETAAMFPFVLLTYDLCVLKDHRSSPSSPWRVHVVLIGIALLAGIARLLIFARVEHPGAAVVHWRYLLVDFDIICRYVGLMIMPVGQAIFHEVQAIDGLLDPRGLAATLIVIAMVVGAWWVRRADGLVALGSFWFLLLLVPSAVLIVLDQGEPMTEHRVYLASCGFFLAAGSAAAWIASVLPDMTRPVRRLVPAMAVVSVLSLSAQTLLRNAVWASPITLWRESVDLAPNHYRPRLALGEALQDSGRRADAVEQYQAAVRMRPNEEAAYMKLGLCLAEMGRLEEARTTFTRLQTLNPQSAVASTGLGAVAMLSRQPDLARQHFLDTIARDPANIAARESLAILDEMDPPHPAEALRLCREIRQLAPGTPGNDECIDRNRARLAAGSPAR